MIQEWFIWFFGEDLAVSLGIVIGLLLFTFSIVGFATFMTWVTKKLF